MNFLLYVLLTLPVYFLCSWLSLVLWILLRPGLKDYYCDTERAVIVVAGPVSLLVAILLAAMTLPFNGIRYIFSWLHDSAVSTASLDFQEIKTRMIERKSKSDLPIPHEGQKWGKL